MKLIMLGTGNAMVTRCYNTCFALQEGEGFLLVDAGGGNGILRQMEDAKLSFSRVHHLFVTHAHTDQERYLYMDDEKYETIKDMGVKYQLNITSLIGAYGKQVKERAEYLLTEGFYDYSGSDAHSYHAIQRAFEHKAIKKNIMNSIRQHLTPNS